MDPQQNPTETQEVSEAVEAKLKAQKLLKYQQELWIDYNALGGLLTNPDGTFKKDPDDDTKSYSITSFAKEIHVDRSTLYAWSKTIPNFWELVKKRRLELGSQVRTAKVWNGVYLRAARGDAEQAKIWLGVFDNWQPPSQKHEVEIGGGLADLLQAVRKRKQIEAAADKRKVIDATPDPTENN